MAVDERDEVLKHLERLYTQLKGARRDLRRSDTLEVDLGVDSLLGVELLIGLEEEFAIELTDDERVLDVRTIGDLIDLVTTLRRG